MFCDACCLLSICFGGNLTNVGEVGEMVLISLILPLLAFNEKRFAEVINYLSI